MGWHGSPWNHDDLLKSVEELINTKTVISEETSDAFRVRRIGIEKSDSKIILEYEEV